TPDADAVLRPARAARVGAAATQSGERRSTGDGVVTTAHLPPGPRWPVALQGAAYLVSRRRFMHALGKRYGSAFTVKLPFFGPTVIISDPAVVKQFFQTRTDVVRNVEPNLDLVLGPGSTF